MRIDSNREEQFEVAVANGEKIYSAGLCKGVRMIIQGISILADLYMLPLEGCDIVLGAQWLRTLGPIIWDFSKLFMQFKIDGNEVKLKGLAHPVDKIVDEQEI